MEDDPILREVVAKAKLVCPNLPKVLLFGSRARGDAGPESDYDVIVVEGDPSTGPKRAGELMSALWGLSASLDLLVYGESDLARLHASRASYAREIVREAKEIHEFSP